MVRSLTPHRMVILESLLCLVRYIHSHYGITSYYDFEATVQLATEVVRSMTEEIIRSFWIKFLTCIKT